MKKEKQIWIVRILLVSLIFCALPIQASAETPFLDTRLDTDSVLVFTPYEGFGTTTIAHFNEALARWNYVAGVTLMRREPTSRHSKTNFPSNDGKSYIYKTYDSRGYVGACKRYRRLLNSSILATADINFNTMFSFANSGISGCFDVFSVFIHEAGHVTGLNDLVEANHSNCVMYYKIDPGEERRDIKLYEATNLGIWYSVEA